MKRRLSYAAISGIVFGLGYAPALAHETKITVEAALARSLGLPHDQRVLSVSEVDEGVRVEFDRDAFSAATRLPFLTRYMPKSITFDVSRRGGFQFRTGDPIGAFTTENVIHEELGRTKASDLDIRGVVPFGLLGHAILNTRLKDVSYRSADGSHETVAGEISLNVFKNQRFFGPSTVQLMYRLEDVRDTVSEGSVVRRDISMGSMLYTTTAGGMDLTPVLKKLWEGAPLLQTISVAPGAPLAESLSKVRAVETNYAAADIAYMGYPIDFGLGKFSVKYQSRSCGGCEGRFDIGADHLFVRSVPLGAVLNELVPEHVWVSGQVKDVDYVGLTFSEDAIFNPFADELQFVPDVRKIGSFDIPTFKFAGFDAYTEFSGEGTLSVKRDEPVVSGRITLKIKKGKKRLVTMLGRNSNDLRTEDLRYRLRKAFEAGKQNSDGSTSFDIEIVDNVVRVGGRRVW